MSPAAADTAAAAARPDIQNASSIPDGPVMANYGDSAFY